MEFKPFSKEFSFDKKTMVFGLFFLPVFPTNSYSLVKLVCTTNHWNARACLKHIQGFSRNRLDRNLRLVL